ncbi:MAG TPA: LCP family protein [Anaerolineales bacterium]
MRNPPTRTVRRDLALPNWMIWALAAAFTAAAVVTALLVYNAAHNLAFAWNGGTGLNPFQAPAGSDIDATAMPGATPTAELLQGTPEPWNGTDRITILFMGLDYRDWESDDGPPRTDSMMLVSIDPVARTAGMLSIPRDLWVEIPGFFEHNRINTAYFLGETNRLPGGGPALAMKTVENLLGVPVSYYAVIDFSAFERMIDEIGGIDVLVHEWIKITPIGEESYWLEPKPHRLDGGQALAYARARKTEGGDFDRAQRQQQVALAILDRVIGFDMVPLLVSRAPALYQELSAGIRTNLTLDQMLSIGLLGVQIPQTNIQRGVISPPEMVIPQVLADGAEVLKPVPDKIRLLRDEIFASTGAIGPSIADGDPVAAAKLEAARIAVLNGAGIEGLAGRTADFLRAQGMDVVSVENADRLDYVRTIVIDYTGNPYTTRYLVNLMGLTESQILIQTIPGNDVDVAVIVSSDWQPP